MVDKPKVLCLCGSDIFLKGLSAIESAAGEALDVVTDSAAGLEPDDIANRVAKGGFDALFLNGMTQTQIEAGFIEAVVAELDTSNIPLVIQSNDSGMAPNHFQGATIVAEMSTPDQIIEAVQLAIQSGQHR